MDNFEDYYYSPSVFVSSRDINNPGHPLNPNFTYAKANILGVAHPKIRNPLTKLEAELNFILTPEEKATPKYSFSLAITGARFILQENYPIGMQGKKLIIPAFVKDFWKDSVLTLRAVNELQEEIVQDNIKKHKLI